MHSPFVEMWKKEKKKLKINQEPTPHVGRSHIKCAIMSVERAGTRALTLKPIALRCYRHLMRCGTAWARRRMCVSHIIVVYAHMTQFSFHPRYLSLSYLHYVYNFTGIYLGIFLSFFSISVFVVCLVIRLLRLLLSAQKSIKSDWAFNRLVNVNGAHKAHTLASCLLGMKEKRCQNIGI